MKFGTVTRNPVYSQVCTNPGVKSKISIETMSVAILIDPCVTALGLTGDTLTAAVELAGSIISTMRYAAVVINNIADAVKPNLAEVSAIVSSMRITISIIQIAEDLDAYAVVDRELHPNKILLNPLLLMQTRRREIDGLGAEFMRRYALFLAVKIVHHISHLLEPHVSQVLRTQTKKRSAGGQGKARMQTLERSKDGAMFCDFGEMVEYDVFGGILDTYTDDEQPIAYAIDELILHSRPGARSGTIVTVKATDYVVTPDLADFHLAQGRAVDVPYKGPRRHLEVGSRWDVRPKGEVPLLDPTF
jgi:hypothetical protein